MRQTPYPPEAYSLADDSQGCNKARKASKNSTEIDSEPRVGFKAPHLCSSEGMDLSQRRRLSQKAWRLPTHPLWARGLQAPTSPQHLLQFSLRPSPSPEMHHTEKRKGV